MTLTFIASQNLFRTRAKLKDSFYRRYEGDLPRQSIIAPFRPKSKILPLRSKIHRGEITIEIRPFSASYALFYLQVSKTRPPCFPLSTASDIPLRDSGPGGHAVLLRLGSQ